jgi:hypothetical protein
MSAHKHLCQSNETGPGPRYADVDVKDLLHKDGKTFRWIAGATFSFLARWRLMEDDSRFEEESAGRGHYSTQRLASPPFQLI